MKARVVITYRDQDGNEILSPEEGQKSYSPETNKLYVYTNGNWEELNTETNLQLNMYDINKQLISQMPVLTQEQSLEARKDIQTFLEETHNKFYMLLCRDINYYTLFNLINESQSPICTAEDEIWACAEYIGDIKSVERKEGAMEIWVQPHENNSEAIVMYLFGYDAGVIECVL